MGQISDKNNPGICIGDVISGCVVQRIEALEEIRAVFYALGHEGTGARLVHIGTEDEENCFSVAFKTVPADSTGVAHILEHTVLCGSRNFPVRDPFFSMIKRSLNTFMNAFTASDWTMYPFCTQNKKDFFNLMDVYLDAAFFPKIAALSFKQEGHRLEVEVPSEKDGETQLVYKGVVYNEMKGAMSSPDQVCGRSLLNALYPDTTYRFNSGGEPSDIPTLTHEALVAFHQRHYHPSNAFFYTYGNLPLKENLALIAEKILTGFDRIDPKTIVPSQPRWTAPREALYYYPLGAHEDPAKKHQACLAWLTSDIQDSFEVLALTLLEEVLLGNSASPLRKALIDSGLGTALSDGTGFDADNRDTMFCCGLKDVAADVAPAVEKIILDTLRQLTETGIDAMLIEGAIHQLEFRQKEISNSPYPYGLKLLMRFCGSWFHGGDPVSHLLLDEDLSRLRREMAAGGFFEGRIKRYFLDNPHRVRFTLSPDQSLAEKEIRRVADELRAVKARLSPSELDRIEADAKALEALQEKQEDVSVLPTLEREDIPPSVKSILESPPYDNLSGACYDQATNGILYFSSLAGIAGLTGAQLPWVPFFCHAFTKVGTKRHDFAEMARRMDLYTGGIGLAPSARIRYDAAGTCLPFVILDGKCLARNIGNMLDILAEYIGEIDFSDSGRLKQLLMEYRAGLESMVINNGHRLAMSLAGRRFSTQTALSETWSGVHQLQFIKHFTDDLSGEALTSLCETLSGIRSTLYTGGNVRTAWIGEDSALKTAASAGADLKACLGLGAGVSDITSAEEDPAFQSPPVELGSGIPREGWSTTSSVSFVAQMFETVRMRHPDAPALSVIAKLLRSLYLHREIREKGGAYGGFALYSPENGLFGLASYRDPHIVSTLNAFSGAASFIRSGKFTDEDVKEALLQVCSELDRPDPPGPSAKKAFMRKFVSLTDEDRKKYKANLLALTREQVVDVSRKYFDPDRPGHAVAVISGEDKLKAANAQLGDKPLSLNRI
jgi:Zn-dependent M16 (insulinase) family peptidase